MADTNTTPAPQCPHCGESGSLYITASLQWDALQGRYEATAEEQCECTACDWQGYYGEAGLPFPERMTAQCEAHRHDIRTPTHFDASSALDTVWDALHGFREDCIPEGEPSYDDQWSDITTAMAWLAEELGLDSSASDDDEPASGGAGAPDFIATLQERGFTISPTGGGCRALVRQRGRVCHVITSRDGDLPDHGDWLFVAYDGDWLANPDAPILAESDSETATLDIGEIIESAIANGA